MRPTRAAYMLAITAGVCVALGVMFGRQELFFLAGVCGGCFVFAFLYLVLSPLNLTINRETKPLLLRAGSTAQVRLSLYNNGKIRTSVIQAIDRVDGSRGAPVYIAPIHKKGAAQIEYQIPTSVRGPLTFGPLDLSINDPFGLGRSRVRAAEISTLLVRAQVVPLASIPPASGALRGEVSSHQKLSASGDEFVRLRPYVVGDELRRVHWRASARTGDLVVRQNEETNVGVVSVLLDISAQRFTDDGFERAVSAAISALNVAHRSDDQLFYMTSSSARTKVTSPADLEAIDLQLAEIGPDEQSSLVDAFGQMDRLKQSGGTFILITGRNDREVAGVVGLAQQSFARTMVVVCEPSSEEPPYWHIRHDGTTDLSLGWDAALKGSRF